MPLPRSKLTTREFDISEFESHMPGWEDSNFGICQERSPAAWATRSLVSHLAGYYCLENKAAFKQEAELSQDQRQTE
jgi:hypothetical protein